MWKNILKQSTYGPRGRPGNYREDKLSEATQEQEELFDFVEETNSRMEQSDPNIPRYTNFDTLIRDALEFATTASKGGRRKNFLRKSSKKTRKRRRKNFLRKSSQKTRKSKRRKSKRRKSKRRKSKRRKSKYHKKTRKR